MKQKNSPAEKRIIIAAEEAEDSSKGGEAFPENSVIYDYGISFHGGSLIFMAEAGWSSLELLSCLPVAQG